MFLILYNITVTYEKIIIPFTIQKVGHDNKFLHLPIDILKKLQKYSRQYSRVV